MRLTQPMVTAGISFLLVTMVVSFFVPLGNFLPYIILFISIASAIFFIKVKQEHKSAIMVIFMSAVYALSSYVVCFETSVLPINRLANSTARIEAVVTDIINTTTGSNGYEIKITEIENLNSTENLDKPNIDFYARLYTPLPLDVDYYDTIIIDTKFFEISSSASFDTKRFYMQENIHIFCYSSDVPIDIKSPSGYPLTYYLKGLNDTLCEATDSLLLSPYSSIVKAMLLGDSSDLDDFTAYNFSKAGILHITAISGLHVSIMAGFILLILRLMRIKNSIANIITITLVWIFVAFTGFNISTLRAGIMITVLMVGKLFGRPANSLNSLFLAGVLIVIQNPLAIADVSLMLTFTSTLGIILCSNKLSTAIKIHMEIKSKLFASAINAISITIGVSIFTLPVVILFFGGVNTLSPLSNLIAIPLTSIVLILSPFMLAFSSMGVDILAKLFSDVISFLLWIVCYTENFFADLSMFFIGANFSFTILWLCGSGIFIVAVYLRFRKYIYKALGGVFVTLLLCIFLNQIITANSISIITVNSYEAHAIVMTYRGRAVIISAKSDGYLNKEISELLNSKNISVVDMFVFLEEDTPNTNDFWFLSKTKTLNCVVIGEENRAYKLISETIKPRDPDMVVLSANEIQEFDFGETDWIYIEPCDSGRTVTISFGEREIVITNCAINAQNANCEFLFFSDEKNEQVEHFYSSYVILLNKYADSSNQSAENIIKAFDNSIELTIDKNGKYRIIKL